MRVEISAAGATVVDGKLVERPDDNDLPGSRIRPTPLDRLVRAGSRRSRTRGVVRFAPVAVQQLSADDHRQGRDERDTAAASAATRTGPRGSGAAARWVLADMTTARPSNLPQQIHHSDRGQYVAVRYTERLAEADVVASVGSVGDSYDNAMAEAFNSLFKAELVRNEGPWQGLDDLEIAVAEYIDWYNHRRLHGELGLVPPVEYEALQHTNQPARQPVGG